MATPVAWALPYQPMGNIHLLPWGEAFGSLPHIDTPSLLFLLPLLAGSNLLAANENIAEARAKAHG